jgi:Micrococcal nuclease (thermonuclease) homologs
MRGMPRTVNRTSEMRASRTAAAAAVIASLTGAGLAAAQGFDTSPQYQEYSPQQSLPRVNLPRPRPATAFVGGSASTEATGSSRGARLETFPSARPEQPSRRTDAGAIRKDETRQASGAAASERTGTPPPAPAETKYPAGTVLEGTASVYDGQNIVVEGAAVRFDGAEAPGLAQQCMTRKSLVWDCGARAAARLRELVSGGRVRCVVTEPLGMGAAAICSTHGISDIGATMIGEGLAVSNGHDRGRYAVQQASARESRRGMWIGPFEAPWTWRARNGQ